MTTKQRKLTANKTANDKRIAGKSRGRKPTAAASAVLKSRASKPLPARQALGLNRKLFSRLSGYAERTIAGWESGQARLGGASKQRLIELQRLQQALASVMKPEFIPVWLQSPNAAFAGLKPLEVVERGEIDRIWRMIYALESGMPG